MYRALSLTIPGMVTHGFSALEMHLLLLRSLFTRLSLSDFLQTQNNNSAYTLCSYRCLGNTSCKPRPTTQCTLYVYTGVSATWTTNQCTLYVHTGVSATWTTPQCTRYIHTGVSAIWTTPQCTLSFHTGVSATSTTLQCTLYVQVDISETWTTPQCTLYVHTGIPASWTTPQCTLYVHTGIPAFWTTPQCTLYVHTGIPASWTTPQCTLYVHTGVSATWTTPQCTLYVHTSISATWTTPQCTLYVHTSISATWTTPQCTLCVHTGVSARLSADPEQPGPQCLLRRHRHQVRHRLEHSSVERPPQTAVLGSGRRPVHGQHLRHQRAHRRGTTGRLVPETLLPQWRHGCLQLHQAGQSVGYWWVVYISFISKVQY